jgi:hypothetical protein
VSNHYVLIATSEIQSPEMETRIAAAVLTVLGRVYAHGLTATALSDRYARRVASCMDENAAEMQPVTEVLFRFSRMAE